MAGIVHLERLLLDSDALLSDRLIFGSRLVCIWGSLRVSDAQHVEWSSLVVLVDDGFRV